MADQEVPVPPLPTEERRRRIEDQARQTWRERQAAVEEGRRAAALLWHTICERIRRQRGW